MFFDRKTIEKKYLVLCLAVFLIGVFIGIEFFSGKNSMNISNEGVSKIFIGLALNSTEISASGTVTIESEHGIKNAIDVLNRIRAKRLKNTEDNLGSQSPSAWVTFFDDNKEINDIYFYDDIILYNREYYRISIAQYKKLIGLCEKYGEIYSEEYN